MQITRLGFFSLEFVFSYKDEIYRRDVVLALRISSTARTTPSKWHPNWVRMSPEALACGPTRSDSTDAARLKSSMRLVVV